jgi:hypothetical protein
MTAVQFEIDDERADRESERLLESVAELCNCWTAHCGPDDCPIEALRCRLHALRLRLASHLSSSASAGGPAGMRQLNESDALLLAELDQLVMKLQSCRPGMRCWDMISRAVEVILQQVRERIQQSDQATSDH